MAITEAMTVTYNGVTINVSRVDLFERRPVYSEDKTQILYDHWHIGVVGLVNNSISQFNAFINPPDNAPVGTLGSLTFKQLGDRLLRQRQHLNITYGTSNGRADGAPVVVLQSPRQLPTSQQFFTMDDRNGPSPVCFKILEIHGTKTLIVYFEIETWQRRCTDYPHSILYHRWEASHDIDEKYLTSRSVRGRAIFSAAMLNDPTLPIAKAPDDWRFVLFHAVPLGFQRQNIQVTADMDGLGVNYSFQDVEQVTNLTLAGNRGIIQLEAFHHSGHKTEPWSFPVRYASLEARVYGLRTTARAQLVDALVDVAASYAFARPFNAGWYESSDLSVDLVNKFAELRMRVEISGAQSAEFGLGRGLFNLNAAQVGAPSLGTGLNGNNNFKENLTNWATNTPSQCIEPPNSDATRGTYTERLVAQILGGDCDFPVHIVDQFGNTSLGNYAGAGALAEWTW